MKDKVLLIAATGFEVEPTLTHFGCLAPQMQGVSVPGACVEGELFDCVVTGVGQLQCAAQLLARLHVRRYSFVIQAGIAGSFSPKYPKGTVVRVTEERCGDFGAEAQGSFLDMSDMGFLPLTHPFSKDGTLRAVEPACASTLNLPAVRSVTVNRTLGEARSIEWVTRRFAPDVVNMEGAALFYVCLLAGVACIELRAISDAVGPRDTSTWDIPGAVRALNSRVIELLESYFGVEASSAKT